MNTLKDIKTYICDMLVYCDVISSKDSSTQSKIAFVRLMGNVAKRIAEKCDKLEKELDKNADTDKQDGYYITTVVLGILQEKMDDGLKL